MKKRLCACLDTPQKTASNFENAMANDKKGVTGKHEQTLAEFRFKLKFLVDVSDF